MSDFTKVTARGDKVVSISKDGNGRDIAIIDRTARENGDYTVAIGYHTETGDWEQGRYGFETQKAAEEWRETRLLNGRAWVACSECRKTASMRVLLTLCSTTKSNRRGRLRT